MAVIVKVELPTMHERSRRLQRSLVLVCLAASLSTVVAFLGGPNAGASPVGTVTTFGNVFHRPLGMAASPDGNMWFTNDANNSIARITPAGVVTDFTDASINGPVGIVAGPDGNLWFTNSGTTGRSSIGRITRSGVVSSFTDPSIVGPQGIAKGPDGALWFTSQASTLGPYYGSIGRITTNGFVSTYTDLTMAKPAGITAGADGSMWFTNEDFNNGSIGRVTTQGAISNFTNAAINHPTGITAGADGALWFTNYGYGSGNSIGRITTAGAVSNFTGTGVSAPQGITAGPDGNLWFTNHGVSSNPGSVGRITPAGTVTDFAGGIAFQYGLGYSQGIAAGGDGNIWFATEFSVGRITPAGVATNFPGNGIGYPFGIVAGPDGNLWFTNYGNNSIGRITPAGVVSNFGDPSIKLPFGIAAGPDGNLWFANYGNNSIGRITTAGVVSNLVFPFRIYSPAGIAAGPDGNLWFTNYGHNMIGRITPAGVVTDFTDASINGGLGITAGPDGNLWFTNTNSIGRITPSGVVSSFGTSGGQQIVAGADGNVWFSTAGPAIRRITPAGVITEFTDPSVADATGITAGPDGNLWFTDSANDSVGRITASGSPGRPTGASGVAGNSAVSVSWVGPVSNGFLITGYTVTASPGGATCSWTSGPLSCNVSGLTNGTPYTFTVTATNAAGTGPPSSPSASVTPRLPTFTAITPARFLESRIGPGFRTVDSLFQGAGPRSAWSTLALTVAGRAGIPVDASAVSLNVTVAGPASAGYVTVFPCGSPQPNASNLNFVAGQTVANAVIAKVGTSGQVCLFTNATTDLVVDVNGYFPAGASYGALSPARLLETRNGPGLTTVDALYQGVGARSAWSTLALTVAGRAGIPVDASAVSLNVTVAGPASAGYVTVFPCGAPLPNASNLNFVSGQTVPNAVIAKVGTSGQVCLFTNAATELVVDVNGFFPAASNLGPLTPARLLETRNGPGLTTVDALYQGIGARPASSTLALTVAGRGGIPVDASAVSLNVTVAGPAGAGYVTVFPCGAPLPNASNLNFVSGQTVPNAVIAKVGTNGQVCLFTNAPTDIVVDANGFFGS